MKLGFVTSNPAFSKPLLDEFDNRCKEVLVYQHTDNALQNAYQLGQLRAQADRVFVDWVQPPLETVLSEFECPVFVRAHRIEMYSNQYLASLPWQKVACLFFIAQHVQDRFLTKLPTPPQRVENVGHVGIDLDFWTPGDARTFEPPYRIVLAGNITPKKRQYTAVQLVADLPDTFRLELYGSRHHEGYGLSEYHENISDIIHELSLEDRMASEGSLPQDQLREKLQRAHFILCPSNEEGCATVVAEGMACGCVPLVNAWRGARDVYPAEWVWRTPLEFYRLCNGWADAEPLFKATLSSAMREYVTRYDAKAIARRVADIVLGPVDAQSVGEWYSENMLEHMIEQYGNARQESALNAVLEFMPEQDGAVLDVGCGTGYITHELAKRGHRAIGQDVARGQLEWARENGPGEFIEGDAVGALASGPFDVVAFIDSLEHIRAEKHSSVMVRAIHALKPGGHVIIRVPHGDQDKQIVEVTVYPKHLRQRLVSGGMEILRYDEVDGTNFEIVARKGAA